MTTDTVLVLRELPTGGRWSFGGFPYGLEPLTLPDPATRDEDPAGDPTRWGPDYAEACRRILRPTAYGPSERTPAAGPGDELYWFRWLTGHQVTFVIWRLMTQLVEAASDRRIDPVLALDPLTRYVRGYCAMLLYTGSCPRDTYERTIRPSMQLRHPSFSGGWAPDYRSVRDLFRGRRPLLTGSADAGELREAIELHETVHEGVAAKLVPDGRSLLRRSEVRGSQDVRLLHLLYDNYFLTQRAPVSRHDVVAQLLRRLVAVTQDVATNGLYPQADEEPGSGPAELRTVAVRGCERDFTEICFQVAGSATRLPGAPARPGDLRRPHPAGRPDGA
ncbi:hypothetical protein [Micromonospora sp. NPDC023956]|uniref:hypothetical protein n=1 Tax=Micromonospora sp. NPDC023956 TaxID=3155722 RepID=UPI0033DD59E6